MSRPDRKVWWFAVTVAFALLSQAAAAETEVREFAIRIDDKKAGTFHMTITRHEDGRVVMEGQANVRVSYLVYTYTYSYQGTETWKEGRLDALTSTSNDDGKKYSVSMRAEGDGLRVQVNGKERRSRPDVWTTTSWRSPDARFHNEAIPLIDADTGNAITARLQHLGSTEFHVLGQTHTCTHYRLTGGLQADLWFDEQGRLVRKDSLEDGHRAVLELVRIRK